MPALEKVSWVPKPSDIHTLLIISQGVHLLDTLLLFQHILFALPPGICPLQPQINLLHFIISLLQPSLKEGNPAGEAEPIDSFPFPPKYCQVHPSLDKPASSFFLKSLYKCALKDRPYKLGCKLACTSIALLVDLSMQRCKSHQPMLPKIMQALVACRKEVQTSAGLQSTSLQMMAFSGYPSSIRTLSYEAEIC